MKMMLPGASRFVLLLATSLLAGCASGLSGAVDPAKFETTSCTDLNSEIGKTAIAISDSAVRRGKISRINVPFWVPGGTKAVTALKDRRTTQIDDLQARQDALETARKRRCR